MDVYSGVTPPDGIDPSLWQLTFQELNNAVNEGFGVVKFGDPDFDFVQELKYNNAVFSAFKSHHKSKELASLIRDENGSLKPFSQFKKDAQPFVDTEYRHLKTEYNTAVRSARTAANWKKWERTSHLYPNLKYLPSRAAVPRPEHKVFYGTVLPMNHSFWNYHTPPLDWGCLCGITNTDEEVSADIPDNDVKIAAGLDNNPAKTKKLFSSSHPYESKTSKKEKKIILKSTEKIFRNSVRKWAIEMLVSNNTMILKEELKYPISFTNEQIKFITGKAHPDRAFRDMLLMDIEEVMKQAVFINKDNKPLIDATVKHKSWYYYKVKLQGKDTFINVFEDNLNRTSRIHAISSINPI